MNKTNKKALKQTKIISITLLSISALLLLLAWPVGDRIFSDKADCITTGTGAYQNLFIAIEVVAVMLAILNLIIAIKQKQKNYIVLSIISTVIVSLVAIALYYGFAFCINFG